jgi:hypothetical protein
MQAHTTLAIGPPTMASHQRSIRVMMKVFIQGLANLQSALKQASKKLKSQFKKYEKHF